MCWHEECRTHVTVPGLGRQLCVPVLGPAFCSHPAPLTSQLLGSAKWLQLVGTGGVLLNFEESSGVHQSETFCFVEDIIDINAFRQPEERSLSGLLEWWIQPVQTQLLSRAPRGCQCCQSLLATGAVLLSPCHRASCSQKGGSSQPLPGLCVMDIPPNPEVTLPAAH